MRRHRQEGGQPVSAATSRQSTPTCAHSPALADLGGADEIASQRPPRGRLSEGADDYPAVVVLDGKTRIVACAAGIQWVIQRRSAQWVGRHFCRTKEGLLRCLPRPFHAAIAHFPERFSPS